MFSALLLLLNHTIQDGLVFESRPGAHGKHVVLIAGDEEYRSEEMLPQLARILSERHGFKCTVLFSIRPEGVIDPEERRNVSDLSPLKEADLCIIMLRFRRWTDDQMQHFVDYYSAGKPILALRTSTHAFDFEPESKFERFGWQSATWKGGFGKNVLGETWLTHWGNHGSQSTLGVVEPDAADHPVLTGVTDVFGTTDVYEAHPPADSKVLLRGRVLNGMQKDAAPSDAKKQTVFGTEQPVNDPMMPIAWIREHKNEAGTVNRVLTCTMGSATDLLDEGFRRFLVNSSLWLVGKGSLIQSNMDVGLLGNYKPSNFGFGGFKKGLRPKDMVGAEHRSSYRRHN